MAAKQLGQGLRKFMSPMMALKLRAIADGRTRYAGAYRHGLVARGWIDENQSITDLGTQVLEYYEYSSDFAKELMELSPPMLLTLWAFAEMIILEVCQVARGVPLADFGSITAFVKTHYDPSVAREHNRTLGFDPDGLEEVLRAKPEIPFKYVIVRETSTGQAREGLGFFTNQEALLYKLHTELEQIRPWILPDAM